MRKLLFPLVLLLGCFAPPQSQATISVVQGCSGQANSVFVQVLTVSCNLTGVGTSDMLLMYAWICGPVCVQPLTSDVTVTASNTLGGGLTWTSPVNGTQQYGPSGACTYGGPSGCTDKQKVFYALTGANSGSDTATFTIAYTGTAPACNCADLEITVLEISGLIASPFDTSNGTSAHWSGGGTSPQTLTDGSVTLPSGAYTPSISVVNGGNIFDYDMIFLAFRGTDTTDILLASSNCDNCSGYGTQAGWVWEAGAAGGGPPITNSDHPAIYYQMSSPIAAVMIPHRSQIY